MTVKEAIDKTDAMLPNVCPYAKKASWLYELDKRTEAEFFSYFTDNERHVGGGYGGNPDRELLIADPFSEVYTYFLALKTALSEGDTGAYSDYSQLFAASYLSFKNHYSRCHKAVDIRINMN